MTQNMRLTLDHIHHISDAEKKKPQQSGCVFCLNAWSHMVKLHDGKLPSAACKPEVMAPAGFNKSTGKPNTDAFLVLRFMCCQIAYVEVCSDFQCLNISHKHTVLFCFFQPLFSFHLFYFFIYLFIYIFIYYALLQPATKKQ